MRRSLLGSCRPRALPRPGFGPSESGLYAGTSPASRRVASSLRIASSETSSFVLFQAEARGRTENRSGPLGSREGRADVAFPVLKAGTSRRRGAAVTGRPQQSRCAHPGVVSRRGRHGSRRALEGDLRKATVLLFNNWETEEMMTGTISYAIVHVVLCFDTCQKCFLKSGTP